MLDLQPAVELAALSSAQTSRAWQYNLDDDVEPRPHAYVTMLCEGSETTDTIVMLHSLVHARDTRRSDIVVLLTHRCAEQAPPEAYARACVIDPLGLLAG